MDTKTILILAGVGVGGYMLFKSQQQPAYVPQQQQAQPGTDWGSLIGGLAAGVGNLFKSDSGKVVSRTGTQKLPEGALSSGQHSSGTSSNWTPPSSSVPSATLGGYYGSLGGSSIGGCGSLGCDKYGSLG